MEIISLVPDHLGLDANEIEKHVIDLTDLVRFRMCVCVCTKTSISAPAINNNGSQFKTELKNYMRNCASRSMRINILNIYCPCVFTTNG